MSNTLSPLDLTQVMVGSRFPVSVGAYYICSWTQKFMVCWYVIFAGDQLCKACKHASCNRTLWASPYSLQLPNKKSFNDHLCFLMNENVFPDSSFVPPLIYSLLGSSRHLGVGPVSIASLVMGTMLSETVSSTHEPDLYLRLGLTATFFAGLFQASLGLFRWEFKQKLQLKTFCVCVGRITIPTKPLT